jgi:hypothetical protein
MVRVLWYPMERGCVRGNPRTYSSGSYGSFGSLTLNTAFKNALSLSTSANAFASFGVSEVMTRNPLTLLRRSLSSMFPANSSASCLVSWSVLHRRGPDSTRHFRGLARVLTLGIVCFWEPGATFIHNSSPIHLARFKWTSSGIGYARSGSLSYSEGSHEAPPSDPQEKK